MSKEYEWDKSGEADEDLQKLESTLALLRYTEPLQAKIPAGGRRAIWLALAAAALVLLAAGVVLWPGRSTHLTIAEHPCTEAIAAGEAWSVTALAGAPRCGTKAITNPAALPVGGSVDTDSVSSAEIVVANIGRVVLAPESRIILQASSAAEHRLQLEYGKLHAQIDAPPRLFLVQTPAALAVDLGCEYTLEVSAAGETRLHVTHGYVSLESGTEAVYVPAGYVSDSFPDGGTSLPYASDAAEDLVQASRELAHAPHSEGAFQGMLRASTGARDTLGLWHLLSRDSGQCDAALERLREITDRDPDPLGLGWGTCTDPDRKRAWQTVLEPLWEI